MTHKIIDKDGTEYKSKRALCEAHNKNYESILHYAKYHSIPFIDALYAEKHKKIIDIDGTEYESKKTLCEAHNKKYNNIREYAKRHHISFMDALYTEKNRQIIDKDGTKYKDKKALCKAHNVNNSTIINYYMQRYSISSAVDAIHFMKNKNKKTINIDDTEYESKKALCKAHNIKYDSVYSYARKHSISFIEAFYVFKNKEKIIDKNGTEYKDKKSLCEAHNLKYPNVKNYADKHNLSLIDALYIMEKEKFETKIIDIDNTEYESIKALCKKYNMNHEIMNKAIESSIGKYKRKYNMNYLEALYYIKDIKNNFTFNDIKIIEHICKSPYWLIEINGIQSIISPKTLASKYIAYLIEKEKEKNMK